MISFTLEDVNKTKYKVWHIPQVPGKPFEIYCETLEEVVSMVQVLAEYDKFQLENNIKPDYANVNGVCIWEDSGDGEFDWYDWSALGKNGWWYDDIWEYIRDECPELEGQGVESLEG